MLNLYFKLTGLCTTISGMRTSGSRILAVVLLSFVGLMAVSAQTPIGSIHTATGFVEIDPFGVGDFVDVMVPEAVYEDSVIRTDYESWAYLSIDGDEFTVAPNSRTPVSSFVSERRRSKGGGFFSRILRELTRSLTPPEQEELVAGGRASEAVDSGTSWVFDVDPNAMYEEALADIEAGEFEMAVESLRLIEYPSDGDFEIEDYYVNLAYSLMGMGDFHAAMSASFEYALADPDPDNADLLTTRLQLLGGISAYYSGEDQVASSMLDAYLEKEPIETASPEAVAAYYLLLDDSGRSAEARRLLQNARRAQPQVDWDELTRQ